MKNKKYISKDFYHVVLNGGLGDVIMALPVLKWGIENLFGERYRVSCPPQYDFLIKDWIEQKYIHPYYDLVTWHPSTSILKIFKNEFFVPRTNLSVFSSMSFYNKIIDKKHFNLWQWKEKKISEKVYNKIKNFDYEKTVTIPVSYRAYSKKWNENLLNQFIQFLIEKNYNIILVGGKKEQDNEKVGDKFGSKYIDIGIKNENIVNLVGEITIEETLGVMQRSKFVVGVTGGLIQLSALTKAKILCICTYTNLFHSLFWRNDKFGHDVWVVYNENGCRFCVNEILVYGYDYNDCIKKLNYECINGIKFDKLASKFEDMEKNKECEKIENFNKILDDVLFIN